MKRTVKVALVLLTLSLPIWANSPAEQKKRAAVPEGGNGAAYTVVSGVAVLGALLLTRKQRATKTVLGKGKVQ